MLLAYGADINVYADNPTHTPLNVAVVQGFTDIVRILLSEGAAAVYRNNANLISILLAYGADAEAAESGFLGWTPLIVATVEGFIDVVRLLLTEGASVSGTDPIGNTALYHATTHSQGAIVDVLLAHGASPDVPNDVGRTPLHAAASHYHIALIRAARKKDRRTATPMITAALR